MVEECNISLCKSNAMELGRLLAELQTKVNKKPIHGIKVEDLNELKDSINSYIFTCKIQDGHANEIRSSFKDAWDAQAFTAGDKISDAIIKLNDKSYYSASKCDKV